MCWSGKNPNKVFFFILLFCWRELSNRKFKSILFSPPTAFIRTDQADPTCTSSNFCCFTFEKKKNQKSEKPAAAAATVVQLYFDIFEISPPWTPIEIRQNAPI